VSTGVGLVYDAGSCAESNQSCCSECNHNSLAASGINATGAVVILNMCVCRCCLSGNYLRRTCSCQEVERDKLKHTVGARWADGTGVQIVDGHTPGTNHFAYTATWCKDEIERRGKCGDGYRNGNGRYYLGRLNNHNGQKGVGQGWRGLKTHAVVRWRWLQRPR
jgi:hypothetical protein